MNEFFSELIESVKQKKLSKDDFSRLKQILCKKYKIVEVPTDIQILTHVKKEDLPFLKKYLKTKPVRTISGVAVVAIMTKPHKCPHGKCVYCPGGVDSAFGNVPQSYTGKEPATMRGIRLGFDPYLQVFSRLEQYIVTGHNPEKVELIIMGGTFPSLPKKYQEEFVAFAFKAMNDFSKLFYKKGNFDFDKFREFFELPGTIYDKERAKNLIVKLKREKGKADLEKEQKRNEKSDIKCVGLTIETRPDYAIEKHAEEMLKLGATRVEIGVQSVFDEVLKKIERGHTVKETIDSFKILKNNGFKINAHYMIGLPGSDKEKDIEGLKALFSDENFRPDMLKIYPCVVTKGTRVYDDWKKGEYKPLTTEEAGEIISEAKRFVPEYCRIMRIQRDIPSTVIEAGPKMTNLRQYVNELMVKKGIKCRCIRCREIKNREIKNPQMKMMEYSASGGKEYFISVEDEDYLIGFCRLRVADDVAFVRELHVYGAAEQIGEKGQVQHRGFGKQLMKKAEEIAKNKRVKKIKVISGVGVREYYRKLGYKREGSYMLKKI
jgi:elongator complex protein 3